MPGRVAKDHSQVFDAGVRGGTGESREGVLKGEGAAADRAASTTSQACNSADPQLKISEACPDRMASTELKKFTGRRSTLFTGCPGSLAACASGEIETRGSRPLACRQPSRHTGGLWQRRT